MYASIHEFPNARGKMYNHPDGTFEVNYTKSGGRVSMMANGNDKPYEHETLDWLNNSEYLLNNGMVLTW